VTDAPVASEDEARRALTRLVRESGRDVLAGLVRVTGDLGLAEDAVQDAVERALTTWPRDGVPPNPIAWLRLVARRRAVDLVRREAVRGHKEDAAVDRSDSAPGEPGDLADLAELGATPVEDDLLRLIFTCCHPALARETQVALALRTLCGLTTAEVARALLVPEATMSKRLTRARDKIRLARIPYRVPPAHELPQRWSAVLETVYLLFNEGYAATTGPELLRVDLVDEAERLARLLLRLQPEDAGARGLLALVLLQDARRAARTGPEGPVLLREQDRSRWDRARIAEGVVLVGEGLRRTPTRPDRYVVQAAIAACHTLAPTYAATDWDAVVSWYDVLLGLDPSPVVRLNRAVAVGERDGAEAGLRLVDDVAGLEHYSLWHASRAALLRRLGRDAEAAMADARAAALPLNDAQRSLLGRG
jgi:RNA polymerase sigma-70 factor (ECF subfamily)